MDMWEPFANSVRAHLTDADDKMRVRPVPPDGLI